MRIPEPPSARAAQFENDRRRPHWAIQTSGYEGTGIILLGVSFTDANTGTAGGANISTGNGAVIRTTDGGNTWLTKYSNPGALITGVSFTDANTGTVIGVDFNAGETLILRTTDGGDTWVNQQDHLLSILEFLSRMPITERLSGPPAQL